MKIILAGFLILGFIGQCFAQTFITKDEVVFKVSGGRESLLNISDSLGYRFILDELIIDGKESLSTIACQYNADGSYPINYFGYGTKDYRWGDKYSFKFESIKRCKQVILCLMDKSTIGDIELIGNFNTNIVKANLPITCR